MYTETHLNLVSMGINLRSFVCLLQITCESCPAVECTTGLFTWMKIVTHYTSVPCKFHLSFLHVAAPIFHLPVPHLSSRVQKKNTHIDRYHFLYFFFTRSRVLFLHFPVLVSLLLLLFCAQQVQNIKQY